MLYNGKELVYMGDIFDTAHELAKKGDQQKCKEFLDIYTKWIMDVDKGKFDSYDAAYSHAKHNLAFFAGFCSNDIYYLIQNTYSNL